MARGGAGWRAPLRACLLLALALGMEAYRTMPPSSIDALVVDPRDDAAIRGFMDDAYECADTPGPFLTYVGGDGVVETHLPNLNVEGVWESARPHDLDAITLATNTGSDRQHMVEGQCNSWDGPLTAVLYLILGQYDTRNAIVVQENKARLDAFHARIEAEGRCALTLVLVSETVAPGGGWAYPYNPLRNQAIARSRTKLVFLLDVDFLVSNGTYTTLTEPEHYATLLDNAYRNQHIVVVPAFEIDRALPIPQGVALAEQIAGAGTKKAVKTGLKSKKLHTFGGPYYLKGHRATDYDRWFSTNETYHIKHEVGFEPFLLVSRLHVPWYDERFRGYGWDKISHMYTMAHAGFRLMVHPSSFVVHRSHPPSAAYNNTFFGEAYTISHKPGKENRKLGVIWREMTRDIRAGRYPTYGVSALAACRPLERWFGPKAVPLPLTPTTDAVAPATDVQGNATAAPWSFDRERARLVQFIRGRFQQAIVAWS